MSLGQFRHSAPFFSILCFVFLSSLRRVSSQCKLHVWLISSQTYLHKHVTCSLHHSGISSPYTELERVNDLKDVFFFLKTGQSDSKNRTTMRKYHVLYRFRDGFPIVRTEGSNAEWCSYLLKEQTVFRNPKNHPVRMKPARESQTRPTLLPCWDSFYTTSDG